jgi:hypothetical protein
MADQPRKVSEEPVANSIGENDRIVILYGANTSSPSLRTISSNNVMNTMFAGLPVHADNTAARAANVAVGALYVTTGGAVMLVKSA